MLASTTSTPKDSRSAELRWGTAPRVPTGMKHGVANDPRAVTTRPALAPVSESLDSVTNAALTPLLPSSLLPLLWTAPCRRLHWVRLRSMASPKDKKR